MNLRNVVIGIASATLLFTSCAKNLSYDEAKKWVSENYTATSVETPKSGKIYYKFSGNGELFDNFKKEMEASSRPLEKEEALQKEMLETEGFINGANFDDWFLGFKEDVTFSLNGKSLSATSTQSEPPFEFMILPVEFEKFIGVLGFNEYGQNNKIRIEGLNGKIEGVNGSINFVEETTFEF